MNMKIIKEKYSEYTIKNKTFDFFFNEKNTGTFDIETTGLSPKNSQLILSGFVLPQDDGNFLCVQIFAESLDEEFLVLLETYKILSTLDSIVTYNGARFDIPFIEKRLSYYLESGDPMVMETLAHCDFDFTELPYNLDLYKLVKHHSDIGKFTPNLSQKTLENYLGIWYQRKDLINGGLSVDLYFEYLATGNPELKRQVLLHNSDDVKQLYRLLKCLPQTDLHRYLCKYGFPVSDFIVDKIKLSTRKLTIEGTKHKENFNYGFFNDEASMRGEFFNKEFNITLNLISHQSLVFVDLNLLDLDLEKFKNCEGFSQHYLVLSQDKTPVYMAVAYLVYYLIEHIYQGGNQ